MAAKTTDAPRVYAPTHGLLASAEIIEDASLEWENGVSFTPIGCEPVNIQCFACPPEEKSDALGCPEPITFNPILIEFGFEWPAFDIESVKENATQQILAGTSSALEHAIWHGCGVSDENPVLSDAAPIGSMLDPTSAIGRMIDELASPISHIGAQGTIHMSATVAAHVEGLLVTDEFGRLRTRFGNHLVVIGAYPSDAIVGHIGDIEVYLGEPFITEAPSSISSNNMAYVRVERTALVKWVSCATFYQEVDVCAGCGGVIIGS